MQMGSVDTRSFSSDSDSKLEELKDKLIEDFDVKLKVNDTQNENLPEEEEEEEEEDEFSFACTNPNGSPVSADVIFQNGLIRPAFPLFNRELLFSGGEECSQHGTSAALRPPLRKLFVEKREDGRGGGGSSSSDSEEPEGPHCVWTGKAVEASPEVCKKSNSTGFSKLWRFRGHVPRSSSDGKDAFVFLTNSNPSAARKTTPPGKSSSGEPINKSEKNSKKFAAGKEEEKKKVEVKTGGATTARASPHEKHYVANRKVKEGNRRKSYLPYRQDIVGVFTNVNGMMSRNIHPF